MKITLPSQRLRAPPAHRIKRNMHKPYINALNIRLAESRRTKVTRQELQQPKVRRNKVVYILLLRSQRLLIRGREFLASVERIGVPIQSVFCKL